MTALRDGGMLTAFGNTAFILVISVGGTVLIGSMTAYAFDRFTFRFRRPVIALFLLAALVPGVTTQVAIFPLLKPAIATVVIVKGIAVYNDFYLPFLYMPSQDLGVISTSLFRFKFTRGAYR